MKPLFALILILTAALSARAALSVEEASLSWRQIITELQAKGINQVGEFNLTQFVRESESVSWQKNENFPPEEITGNRRSAYYDPKNKKVYMSEVPQSFLEKQVPLLSLHETLGALGYDDINYSLSTALSLLNQMNDPAERKFFAETYGRSLFNAKSFKVAGTSSVSGGGDLFALHMKSEVLESLMKEPENFGPDLREAFPEIAFEPIYSRAAKSFVIRYAIKSAKSIKEYGAWMGVRRDRNYQDVLRIFVPLGRWQESKAERLMMIEEIKNRLLDIYPPMPKGFFLTKMPKTCSALKQYTMMNDTGFTVGLSMITLRSTQEWLKRGCPDFVWQTRFWSSGQFPFGAEPEDAGNDFYECHYKWGKTEGSKNLKIIPRGMGHYSYMESIEGKSEVLFIKIITGKDGKMDKVELSYDSSRLTGQAQSPQHGEISGQLLGQEAQISCDQIYPRDMLPIGQQN